MKKRKLYALIEGLTKELDESNDLLRRAVDLRWGRTTPDTWSKWDVDVEAYSDRCYRTLRNMGLIHVPY